MKKCLVFLLYYGIILLGASYAAEATPSANGAGLGTPAVGVAAADTGSSSGYRAPNIAMLPLTGDAQTTPQQLEMIGERLQAELIKSKRFVVLDRAQMDDILREQGFVQSGACDNSNCQVEVGQLLGVEKLISGKVVSFGNVWAISASVTNVSSGAIEASYSIDVDGQLVDLLREGVPDMAAQISGLPYTRPARVTPPAADKSGAGPQGAVAALPRVEKRSPALKWTMVAGMGLLGAGAAAWGYLQQQEIEDAGDAYRALDVNASTTDFDAAWANYENTRDEKSSLRNIGYGSGALLLLGAVGVTLFF
jgi:hypothetical protein